MVGESSPLARRIKKGGTVMNISDGKVLSSSLCKVALTFGLIFNLSFSAAPFLSTGRLALLVMIIAYGKDAFRLIVQFAQKYTFSLTLSLSLILFSMLWLAINSAEDSVMFSRAFWFFIFVIVGSFLYVRMCRFSLTSAMMYYLTAMLAQALFVFNSVLDPEFRDWVEQALIVGGNIDFSEGVRFSGLTNGGGALLSVQLALGVAASLVLFSQSRSSLVKLGLVIGALLLVVATVFVGRTGLYFSILMILGFILFSGRPLLVSIIFIVSVCIVSLFFLSANTESFDLEDNPIKLDRTVSWAFDIFLFGESDSANSLVNELSNIREISAKEIFIGSGRLVEHDGSNYSKHDSGYLHLVYALGLPLSALFYGALFWIYWKNLLLVKGKLKVIGLVLVALVFFLEIKEPFIFKYTLPFFVLVYVILAPRGRRRVQAQVLLSGVRRSR